MNNRKPSIYLDDKPQEWSDVDASIERARSEFEDTGKVERNAESLLNAVNKYSSEFELTRKECVGLATHFFNKSFASKPDVISLRIIYEPSGILTQLDNMSCGIYEDYDRLLASFRSVTRELHAVTTRLNDYERKDFRCDQLDPPELTDMQTVHEAYVLLRELGAASDE